MLWIHVFNEYANAQGTYDAYDPAHDEHMATGKTHVPERSTGSQCVRKPDGRMVPESRIVTVMKPEIVERAR